MPKKKQPNTSMAAIILFNKFLSYHLACQPLYVPLYTFSYYFLPEYLKRKQSNQAGLHVEVKQISKELLHSPISPSPR